MVGAQEKMENVEDDEFVTFPKILSTVCQQPFCADCFQHSQSLIAEKRVLLEENKELKNQITLLKQITAPVETKTDCCFVMVTGGEKNMMLLANRSPQNVHKPQQCFSCYRQGKNFSKYEQAVRNHSKGSASLGSAKGVKE